MPPNTEAEESRVVKIMWKAVWAGGGFGAAIVASTLFLQGTKTEAHDAKCGVDGLEPRVKTLEIRNAEDRIQDEANRKEAEARYRMLEEVRSDVKELLKRTPK